MSDEIHTYDELQKLMHDALRTQHPELIEPNGDSPICDSYDARLAELLRLFTPLNETQPTDGFRCGGRARDVRPFHMSAKEAPQLDPDAQHTCKAARKEMTAALSELARLHSQLPMSREAFATKIQRIADEHAQPCGCKLLIQHNSDGLVELRIKAQTAEFQCAACKTSECFFHPRTE